MAKCYGNESMSPWQVWHEFHCTPCRSKVQELRALRGPAALLALLASCHSSWVALALDSHEVVQDTGSGTLLYSWLPEHFCCNAHILSLTKSQQHIKSGAEKLRTQDHRLPRFAGNFFWGRTHRLSWGMTFLSAHSSRRGLVVAHQHKKQRSDLGFVRQLVSVRMSLWFSILGATAKVVVSHHRYTLAILSCKFDPPQKTEIWNSNIHLQRTHNQFRLSVLKSVLSWAVYYRL